MTVGILTEKPSAARAMAKALGGASGNYQGTPYIITHARGHLYELAQPEDQVPKDLAEQYRVWDLEQLPWDHTKMAFKMVPIRGASDTIKKVQKDLAGVDEIAIATDIDPSGEGDAIAWNALIELGLDSKKMSRMEFTDESPASFRKAFENRRPIQNHRTEGVYRKAQYRNFFDFLTMQFTRIATIEAGQRAVLRQGRLKSAMVLLVGEQLKAHKEYVKKPFFENRFRDDHGVMYTNPDEPRFASEGEVDTSALKASEVVVDSRQNKHQRPPALLDLAGLSSRLSSKSYKAKDVLDTYQKMYEAQVVSYPRTEDRTITTEQFNELLPKVDQIAKAIGVDPGILTHRTPRSTHVKDVGAHGANRPGPNVPPSLDAVEQQYGSLGRHIYEELARSFLAMFAVDYTYEAQAGHVKDFPKFKGSTTVPKVMGWKDVFFEDKGDDEEDEATAQGLGSTAEPFVFGGANPRPPHPTMKWLMKQLERRNVGTGATRTSTYSEVTAAQSARNKYPLMADRRGKITLTEFGDMSFMMLPGTKIGDLTATEQVFATMEEISDGKKTIEDELGIVAEWVRHDLQVMKSNGETMRQTLGLTKQAAAKPKVEGVWNGKQVKINAEWSGHKFTEAELQKLFAGETIEFEATSSKTGNTFQAKGKLAEQEFKGHKFVGFKVDFAPKKDANGKELPPEQWCGVKFSPQQIADLQAGKGVKSSEFFSKKTKKNFTATLYWKEEGGRKKLVPTFGK